MYVLKRRDGKYVAKPGSKKSYTTSLEKARKFPSPEAADADRCPENESIVNVMDLL